MNQYRYSKNPCGKNQAEGTEIGSVLRSVTRINRNGEIEKLKREDLSFEYRKTAFPDEAGILIDPAPSFAWAIGITPAATKAELPPDEPPVE